MILKMITKNLVFLILACLCMVSEASVTKSIKDFGAKGDGITNDHEAFIKAAEYFKKNRGNGKLIIPAGTYIVGKQIRSKTPDRYFIESDAFFLSDCNNFIVEGQGKAKIKYTGKLKFGSFNPANDSKLSPSKMPFYDASKSAQIGCLFRFENCSGIQVINIEADGNNMNMIIGGPYGDMGIQLWHYGLHFSNCANIKINKVNMHHFCLDGLLIRSSEKREGNYTILSSSFTYNGRQGFSWVGGRDLVAKNCAFDHNGQAKIATPPSAGLDIEPESGHNIYGGSFENCTFRNNKGCGLNADAPGSSNMVFKNCTFWGLDSWSAWVMQKSYSFYNCNFFGSFVKGYLTSDYNEATKFFTCVFQDSSYNGKPAYGKYLIECDSRKKMIFDKCSFIAKNKKIMWYNGTGSKQKEDQPVFTNCITEVNGKRELLKK